MSQDEKLELIEKVVHAPEYSLQEDTLLNNIPGWESLNILNLQMELAVLGINVNEVDLQKCTTIEEVCRLMD